MADISKIKTPNGTTYDISVSRNKVGKVGDNFAGGLDAISTAMIPSHSANKTFGLPANAITIEYSTDGGSTWHDYGATDSQKKSLFMETRPDFYLGKNSSMGTATINHRLRITIEPTDRYIFMDAVYVWMSTGGNTVYMDMETSTIGDKNTFTTIFTRQPLRGWAGANIRYFNKIEFGGWASQTSNGYKKRLTFYQTAVDSSWGNSCIKDIRFFGDYVSSRTNNMMFSNHMYSWDSDMNVTFPAQVKATYFNGTASNAEQISEKTNSIKSGSSAISASIIVAGDDGLYKNLKTGTAFNVRYPIYYASSAAANAWISSKWLQAIITITGTQSITLTQGKPVYIKGHLNGTVFTPISTAPLTQTIPTSADGCQYIFLGVAYSATGMYLKSEHPIYQFRDGKFALYEELPNDTLDIQKKQYIQQLKDLCMFAEMANG